MPIEILGSEERGHWAKLSSRFFWHPPCICNFGAKLCGMIFA